MIRDLWPEARILRIIRNCLIFVVTVLGARITGHAIEVKPVINAQILGGQSYYNGTDSPVGMHAFLLASPYTKFNEKWSLVPIYSGSYQGTRLVQDVLGGNTLFEDSQDHIVSMKVIRSFQNGLRLKAVTGYGVELLRETVDESWTKGLYDNRRIIGGTEAEWFWRKDRSVRLAYDYYGIRFPNYQSLSSEAADQGQGRELDAPDVLDTQNHMVTLGTLLAVPGDGQLNAFFSHTWSSFSDQHLVDASGSLISDLRSDRTASLGITGTWPVYSGERTRLVGSLGYARTHYFSNQNHYDASRTVFNGNYYGYMTNAIKSDWTLALGQAPWTLQLNGMLSRQNYADRLVQDSAGNYGTDTTHVDYASLGMSVSYPIAKGFQVKAVAALGWNDSNNTYSQLYQYHYQMQNYLLGFSYAY